MTAGSQPQLSSPRLDLRSSSGTSSTFRSSYKTADTRRTSTTSMNSGRASSADEMASAAIHAQPRGTHYICPCCNMGDGHVKRSYNRSGGTSTEFVPTSLRNSMEFQNTYKKPSTFDKHIRERHRRLFERTGSTQFVCVFCLCKYPCAGRFYTEQELLDHLRATHAQIPEQVEHTHHVCGPLV